MNTCLEYACEWCGHLARCRRKGLFHGAGELCGMAIEELKGWKAEFHPRFTKSQYPEFSLFEDAEGIPLGAPRKRYLSSVIYGLGIIAANDDTKPFWGSRSPLAEAQGLTQLELAELLGVGRSYLFLIGEGKRDPGLRLTKSILDWLQTSMSKLLSQL